MTAITEQPLSGSKKRIRLPGYGTHNSRKSAQEERWIPTVCHMCYNSCSIQVLVRDGVAAAIEGLPGGHPNNGKMCAKGKSALAGVYSPRRVTKPLKRTNPEKGIDVDPKWEEISWKEALDIITTKLNQVRQNNPNGLGINTFDWPAATPFLRAFLTGFGGGHYGGTVPLSQNMFCGRGVHPVALMMSGSADQQPDLNFCKYLLIVGGGFGTGTGTHAMHMAKALAEARVKRSMKMVVVDPCRTSSGARADEWIPIVPGTDAAFCLSLTNVLINELGIYDKEFLRTFTNSPYLIRPNGHYARDPLTNKPLILSQSQEIAVPYDSIDPKDTVLEGQTEVNGEPVLTAFTLLRNHVKQYTPEHVSQITKVPASTIRRIASEFGQAAQIGATVEIDGVTLPLRPASIHWYRGVGQHQHGLLNGWATAMVAMTVGSVDVPGGHCGTETTGPWGLPTTEHDGLLTPANPFTMESSLPPRKAHFDPHDPSQKGLFPVTISTSSIGGMTLRMPEQFKLDFDLDFFICARSNPMKAAGDPNETAEILKKIGFQLSFVQHHEETSQFADVILPDTHYLERLVPFAFDPYNTFAHTPGPEEKEWYFGLQQPVIKPMGEARHWVEVLWELAHRLDFAEDFYKSLSVSMQLDPAHATKSGKQYTYEEFADLWLRSWCGEEHGLAYFREHGWASAPVKRQVKDRYPRMFHKGRIPMYLEHWLGAGEDIREEVKRTGITWGDMSDYQPLVSYRPCWASEEGSDEFAFYLESPKVGFLTLNSSTIKNPHLQELAWAMGEIFNLGIHPVAAQKYGIETGDLVEIESANGRKTIIVARVTTDVHPNVVSAPGNVAKVLSPDEKEQIGQGVHLNSFIPYQLERIDMVSGALDACVKVRIRKVSDKS